MLSILKKEFKSYFISPTGYIFLGFSLFLAGLFFVNTNLANSTTDMSGFFGNISIIFLFLVPLLTMRLFSEERRNKTDQLLITSPVTVMDIVLGKYLAAIALFGLFLVITLLYPLMLSIYGTPVVGSIIALYIGYFLLGSALISVGLLITALTESQVTAAIATFAVILVIWFADWFISVVSNRIIVAAIQWLSVLQRFQSFVTGIFSLSALIYFISFAALFVFLTVQAIEKRRWS